MQENKLSLRYKNIKKVGAIGIFTNIFLLIIKRIICSISHSQFMVGDSLNKVGYIIYLHLL